MPDLEAIRQRLTETRDLDVQLVTAAREVAELHQHVAALLEEIERLKIELGWRPSPNA